MQHQDITWDLPAPFTIDITVRAEDTERLGHANNVVYVRWLEDVSWAHIESLGMSWAPVRQKNSPTFSVLLLWPGARGSRSPELFCALLQLVLFKVTPVKPVVRRSPWKKLLIRMLKPRCAM